MTIDGDFMVSRMRMDAGRLAAGPLSGSRRAPDGGALLPGGSRTPVDRRSPLYQACQDFEAIFLKQMLNAMRQTVDKGEMLHGGFAEEVFEDMLYDEYSKKMAQTAGFGLSELLYRQLSAGGQGG